MAEEKRLYAQFTLDSADSHKIAPLSDAAFRAWFRMIIWSRRMMSDGRVPGSMARHIARPKVLTELCSNDPVNPSLRQDEAGDYWLHDFLEHQPSRAQIEAKQATNRANGARGGQARAKRVASETEAKSNTETETETETSSSDEELLAPEPAKRGSRLSRDWHPGTEAMRQAAAVGPALNVELELEKFRDYWAAASGAKGVKADWRATWRNWVRNAQQRAVERGWRPERRVPEGEEWMTR